MERRKENEREREREREREEGREIEIEELVLLGMPLLVLEGAFYRISNDLSLLPFMERVMKNNKVVP